MQKIESVNLLALYNFADIGRQAGMCSYFILNFKLFPSQPHVAESLNRVMNVRYFIFVIPQCDPQQSPH